MSSVLGVIFLIFASTVDLSAGIDSAAYQVIPPLYASDDYQRCFQSQSAASFCMVYAEIQPNNNSSVWQQIEDIHNAYYYHYRHDQLYRGVCTSKCMKYPKSQNLTLRAVAPYSDNMHMGRIIHAISQKQKSIEEYKPQLHACVHGELQKEYNISVRTLVTYCDDPNEPIEKGYQFYVAIVIFVVLGLLNILSTLYDLHLKSQLKPKASTDDEYFDKNHKDSAHKYLTSFSLYRNYRRLVVANNSAIGRDLSFIDGFRTLLSMIIVIEHMTMTHYMHIQNPEFFERLFATIYLKMGLHMYVVIELFFLLSGLMLFIKFDKSQYVVSKSSFVECITVYVRMVFSRYLRYMPSLLLLILFSSQILIHLQSTPYWRHILEPHVILCRNKLGPHLLMTANLGLNNTCWAHTWYISADFQLYAFFLIILVIVARYPQSKNFVYGVVGILGVLLPGVINYTKKLDSATTVFTDHYRHMYFKDVDSFEYMYFPPHTNLNGFFVGLLCGELYMKYLKHNKYKEMVGRYLKWAPLFGWLTICVIWYLGSLLLVTREHYTWKSIFVVLNKNLSVTIVATIVVLLKMCNGGGFLTWPVFRLLARISYQVYLWHFIVLVVIFANFQQPIDVSLLLLTAILFSTYILGAVVAFFIAIMVEYPMAELIAVFELKKEKYRNSSKHMRNEMKAQPFILEMDHNN